MEKKIKLAIKGHPTRGEEVIEILKMLGGVNNLLQQGWGKGIYFIDHRDNIIYYIQPKDIVEDFTIFTLEEFLENFPYKTGDSVFVEGKECLITDVIWHNELNCIRYEVFHTTGSLTNGWYYVCNLQPYKEETMEEKLMPIIDFTGYCKDKYIMNLDNYEIKEEKGVIYAVRKQSEYAKTYEECCKVLGHEPDRQTVTGYDAELIENLQTLKLCRDAYWKIAGDWEEKRKEKVIHYVIYSTLLGEVVKDATPNCIANYLLDFPTAEMREAFYKNFKDLIESCKELL